MKIDTITVIAGEANEFYTRVIWNELIKAGASFTIEIDGLSSTTPNKVCFASAHKDTKPDYGHVERIMCWINSWLRTHCHTQMTLRIYTPLTPSTARKLSNMCISSCLELETCTSHAVVR